MNVRDGIPVRPAGVGGSSDIAVLVNERRDVADDIMALSLTPVPGAGPLPSWAPGAHIDVVVENSITRQYSLCGDPDDQASYRIAVLRIADGRGGSQLLHDIAAPGHKLTIGPPRNNFELAPADSYLFVAGGIGITPILTMIDCAEKSNANWKLLYGGRTRSSMAFLDELAEYGERVIVRPQDQFGLLDLDGALADTALDTEVYACGPEPLLAALEVSCKKQGRPGPHLERFSPKLIEHAEDSQFEVRLERSNRTVVVPAGCSVLEAIESEGMAPPFTCREGTCGTCETTVLAGRVDHRDSILSEEERAVNDTMMICVSRCFDPKLVLDL
ncbi:PDR/VanB family oxidoreductase [Rhodococcus sp. 14C212]|uniref:PDR/VanB family oxidoreductase n=1 Tax=Rhodococcus sp. 14C212 TaxID=2711209 RepID=UPI003211E9FD